jgi:hypothetical protein
MFGGSIVEIIKRFLVMNVVKGEVRLGVKENVCGMKMHALIKVFH